ncbi:formate--tetrahydrofolate ligase (plasmid) [Pseudochrobactrum algeriensis]|uniref:formate--tetrahydrofolate ligase n=1 Tax=Pseudochrobactrum algeriensis TaxID=2834768 RepID=UPI001BCEA131|nr:formate--tetrahydrofolate ligase [Pseudochrobactrum algeriensis]MBX8812514.1 formate--tetrahydrofolate ligase [Ochrobactrum sp. MR34]QVQ35218.1 formate--tetrahydrofolate ligase [Pseudochrobactrum algeriensis]QVQ41834.1 formate--tetrahydrofolate ligase [Pseudochrobactrum algeriensis]QVQ42448.1 formate--tetrahydrofolate ligase [Pseudochrobactrum algeriensis]
MYSDIEIARAAQKRPIIEIAAKLNLGSDDLLPYGHDKAKLTHNVVNRLKSGRKGKLILVTSINPTPAGEGKTTTSVGLGDALNKIGKKAVICLREPSLGPNFGMKGGAAGGGKSQVIPMEDINLHFTGDFHAISSANNLLAAMIDNHIHWGNSLRFDTRRISWRRVVDMNDRALRDITIALGGPSNGYPRESGFDISVASEVMAILCLAEDLTDLKARLARIIVGYNLDKQPITAADLKADGAMTALLKDALQPNLVQTIENNPVLIHGGPFANIAHGCNSVIATKTALALGDYVVTEAGFGADLGAEKFFNIKCRKAGLSPDAVVVVATIRALKMNGGVPKSELGTGNAEALKKGSSNLIRHIRNVQKFGLPVVVAINHFATDTHEEIAVLNDVCNEAGVKAILCRHWSEGGAGAEDLAYEVAKLADNNDAELQLLYEDSLPLWEKIQKVAREIYGAEQARAEPAVLKQLEQWERDGFGHLPVCMAKTQYSFSVDPTALGAPSGHIVPVREVKLSAGAGFIVAICGNIMTMPGLPRTPAAEHIGLNHNNEIQGLF